MEEITIKKPSDHYTMQLLLNKIKTIPLPILRTVLKASIAVLISLIFVLVHRIRLVVGPASTLMTLGTLLYFPVKPVDVQLKIIVQGTLSAVIGSAWCYFGNYVANLARNPAIESPIQPASSAVSAVFCVILMFVLGYVRARYPQSDFATIFASMIASFALTQNASAPGFQPDITTTFLKPLLFASAISLVVNLIIWPEDSVTKYLDTLTEVLAEYDTFFQENTTAFLGNVTINQQDQPSTSSSNISLPILRTKLQETFIKLVDSQHEVSYAVLYHQFSHKDISKMTQLVKSIHTPLHGLGLSIMCKHEQHHASEKQETVNKVVCMEREGNHYKLTLELIQVCNIILSECNDRVSNNFKESPRSIWSTFLWPFPRIGVTRSSSPPVLRPISLDQLDNMIARYREGVKNKTTDRSNKPDALAAAYLAEQQQQLEHLFQFNLVGYADSLRSLAFFVDQIDRHQRKGLWFPRVSLKNWLKPSASNCANVIGGQVATDRSLLESTSTNDGSSFRKDSELGLNTLEQLHQEVATNDEDDYVCAMNRNNRPCPRDPDVDAPSTTFEYFFNYLSIIFNWFYSMETLFAFKTAAGFIFLSLPAYLPNSVSWYSGWGGQWIANTLIMWVFPMAGMFNFTIILGLLGTVAGGVLSIIVWEIVRGNPYGIAILSFVAVFIPFQYMFFTNQVYSFMAIMTQFTYLMVMTTGYQDAVGGALKYDTIEVAAGKRMLFVVLGILGAAIVNWFPRPVTGRVELRKRISKTFRDLSMLYGVVFADILVSYDVPLSQVKAFKKLALSIQRQLKDEETYLRLSKLEPPLKGKFPFETYRELIERLNNMADLTEGMAYAAASMDKSWRRSLVQVLNEERFDYITCLLNIMRSLSATLISKMALPPYMISPKDLKDKLNEKLCSTIQKHPEQLYNETFPSYCAYSVASSRFTDELNAAYDCVSNLVGVDNPEKWLLLNS